MFGQSHMTESSEGDEDGEEEEREGQRHDRDREVVRGRRRRDESSAASDISGLGRGGGTLVDVNLASTIHEEDTDASLIGSASPGDEPPAPYQTFRTPAKNPQLSSFLPYETDEEANIAMPRPGMSLDRESVPPTIILPAQQPTHHDAFWGNLYLISLFALLAAFVLIYFHTSLPSSKKPLGDSIYTALRASTSLLLWDTILATTLALIWLALLRSHVRTLVFAILVLVPILLVAFSLYPFIASFHHTTTTTNYLQDRVLRYLSPLPALLAAVWAYNVYTTRHSIHRAISILEFATAKILPAAPHLLTLGFATLAAVIAWTWLWLLMFTRIFLSGHFASSSKPSRFILDASSYWLAAAFLLHYLWTLTLLSGIQRAATAATVSQWYFHRLAIPQPSSDAVVRASLAHALGPAFGSIALSSFLSLLIRLPLILLPANAGRILNICAYWLVPSSLAALTNPLTLTYAAVHSQPLGISARGLSQLRFISATNPSATLGIHRRRSHSSPSDGLIPYRLSKTLLHATRYVMALALAFGGWIRTAHSIDLSGGVRGSLYAYLVGFMAGAIGFAVLGAVENVVGGVVDAAVVCWGSESAGGGGRGGVGLYCREAGEMFGGEE